MTRDLYDAFVTNVDLDQAVEEACKLVDARRESLQQ